jgi:hypothetical protein
MQTHAHFMLKAVVSVSEMEKVDDIFLYFPFLEQLSN